MEALGQGLGTQGWGGTSLPSIRCSPVGKTRWKAVRSTDILGSKREISSLGIETGFVEEAAPKPNQGDKGLGAGARVGGVHTRSRESVSQSAGWDRSRRHCMTYAGQMPGSSEAGGQSGERRVGLEAKQKSVGLILCTGAPGQVSRVPMPSKLSKPSPQRLGTRCSPCG